MKKFFNKRLLAILMAMVMCFVLASCSDDKDKTEAVDTVGITISIDYPVKSELEDIEEEVFKIEEGASVLDATQLYCNVNDIHITVETTDQYIQGINNVENNQYGKDRHWQYKINGSLCSKPENLQTVSDGDSVEWVYRK